MDDKITSDDISSLIPFDHETKELADKIIKEKDLDELKNLTHIFNVNQAKKNALRIIKLNSLLDHVSDEMIKRFENVPGNFSNTDLLNYMNVVQTSIDRSNKALNLIDQTPTIQLNQLNVNINQEDELSRESREKVADAVKAILSKLNMQELQIEEPAVIIEDQDIQNEENTEENITPTKLLSEEE